MYAFDARWLGLHGIGRFATELEKRVPFKVQFADERHPAGITSAIRLGHWLRQSGAKGLYSPGYIPPIGSRLPFVFTLHDLNHLDVPHNSSLAKRLFYSIVIRPAVDRAYRVVTVSEYSKQRIVEWAGCSEDKIKVACNGVSSAFREDAEPATPGYPYLFCCSNRKGHKNEGRLLAAFKASGLHRALKLVLTGAADENISLKIRALGIEDRVMFTGRISEEALAGWYRGAIATVFPSLYEGFGLPLIESMACGTPVVTSNTTSLPEVGGSAAIYVDPLSVESIAAGMTQVVEDDALRFKLKILGRDRAALFTWDRAAACVSEALIGMTDD